MRAVRVIQGEEELMLIEKGLVSSTQMGPPSSCRLDPPPPLFAQVLPLIRDMVRVRVRVKNKIKGMGVQEEVEEEEEEG